MRRRTRPAPRIARPSRAVAGPALAALCALALAACGTERPGEAAAARAGGGESKVSVDDSETEGPEFLPFMEFLVSVAEPCVDEKIPTLPPDEQKEMLKGPVEVPSSSLPSDAPVSVPDDAPPAEPAAEGNEEAELGSVEKCAARNHARAIKQALKATPDPTPQQVSETLRNLGYIDERIHGPQRASDNVDFTLDLRVLGGSLCLNGSTTGTSTTVKPYAAPADVECRDL